MITFIYDSEHKDKFPFEYDSKKWTFQILFSRYKSETHESSVPNKFEIVSKQTGSIVRYNKLTDVKNFDNKWVYTTYISTEEKGFTGKFRTFALIIQD